MAEDHRAVAAARILLTLRTRKLTDWPDWILPPPPSSKDLAAPPPERPSAERDAQLPPLPERWPKRPRDPLRARDSGWSPSLDGLFARLLRPAPARSGGSYSDEEERAWSPPRVRKQPKRDTASTTTPSQARSGSGPSTSGGVERRARLRVSLKVGTARKEAFVQASSPETPFDYAIAARSGASSSGDEGAPPKRKARGASRSPSGDEGCSSPAKRSRPDGHGTLPHSAAVKVEVPKIEENNRDEKGHLLFDLNEDISPAW